MIYTMLNQVAQITSLSILLASKSPATVSEAPAHRQVKINGDLMFGGLFPVHAKQSLDIQPCGELMEGRGIHRVEAMLYALDRINANKSILPTITLGALILDTCSTPAYALNQSLEFVKDLMGNFDSNQFQCSDGSTAKLKNAANPVAGVIGGSYSGVSTQVANLLRLFKIVQISPASTSADLSDKKKYEYFARTVPSDNYQAEVMAHLCNRYNWTYVSLIYSAEDYGEMGADAFKEHARLNKICIAIEEKISSSDKLPEIMKRVFDKSYNPNTGTGAKVVILFARNDDVRLILEEFEKLQPTENVIWLASEGWEMINTTTVDAERSAEGAIVVTLQSNPVESFEDYFLSLHPGHPKFKRNAWLSEFWEHHFNCHLVEKNWTKGVKEVESRKLCSPSLRLQREDFSADNKVIVFHVQFVINAVYALAHALHQMWEDICTVKTGDSARTISSVKCMQPKDINGEDLYKTLQKVSFKESAFRHVYDVLGLHDTRRDPFLHMAKAHNTTTTHCPCPWTDMLPINASFLYSTLLNNVHFLDVHGIDFHLNKNGDGPARYEIKQFQKSKDNKTYSYVPLGTWKEGYLDIEDSQLSFSGQTVPDNRSVPMSKCSLECSLGERKSLIKDDICCWACIPCHRWEKMVNETTCEDCGQGFWPTPNRSSCYDLSLTELQYMRWNSVYSVVPALLSAVGILITLQVIGVFIWYDKTPVVKASGRELSYILLFGLIVCYCMTYVLLTKPNPWICGIKRIGVGTGFSILYAAMLVKTNRIHRIFASAKRSAVRPKFISPLSQVVITSAFVLSQTIGSIIWLIVTPPNVRYDFPTRHEVVLRCNVEDHWFLVSLVYDMILIIACTIYAVKTRKVPENFNETKFIGFTMYTTCIIWLAFVPIYFGTGNNFEIQTTTMCISVSLSASVALFCLYSPKIWVILLEPEKNTIERSSAMSTKPKIEHHSHGSMSIRNDDSSMHSPTVFSPLLGGIYIKPYAPCTTGTSSLQRRKKLNNDLVDQNLQEIKEMDKTRDSLESLTSEGVITL